LDASFAVLRGLCGSLETTKTGRIAKPCSPRNYLNFSAFSKLYNEQIQTAGFGASPRAVINGCLNRFIVPVRMRILPVPQGFLEMKLRHFRRTLSFLLIALFIRTPVSAAERLIQDSYQPAGQATLFFFTAAWCGPCHRIRPILEKACRQSRRHVRMLAVDYDWSPGLVEDFGVRELPTMILASASGKILIRVDGASREGLDALLAGIRKLRTEPAGPPFPNEKGR
jgi:thiol-disulfide isomerase/thioredoxin